MFQPLSDKEFIDQLIEAGWTPEEAAKELERALEDAAIEDGMED